MECFNVVGLAFMVVMMVPNIIFAIKSKDSFENTRNNTAIEIIEQIGRFGCFGFMIFNVPGTCFGWWSDKAFAVYLIVDSLFITLYCAIWIFCLKKNSIFKALTLSVIPSLIFLFSGIMSRSVLLIVSSILFAPSHILISYQNAARIFQTPIYPDQTR